MNEIKFTLKNLHDKAPQRKPGYVEAVMKLATISGDTLSLSLSDFEQIRKDFSFPPVVIPRSEWPLFLRPMKLLAQPGDLGLGDIIERTIGPVGGDAYKLWYKATFGKTCGCTKRKDNLNIRFPL